MADYTLEEKEGFTVLGIGTELKSDYTDYAGINKEKADFWQAVKQDGRLDKLKAIAANDYIFTVNEAVNNKMMHYAGVMTEESLPEASRLIQFPKGEYIVVKGEAETAEMLSNMLTGMAFGQVLPEATNVAYVGGPNAAVEMGQRNGLVFGEMWIPVVRK
ncbi:MULTISPECIES: GyrI-like domain-containing protein [Cytobacillus]|jgi:predicted transcriptional regulator YdeE|uniref:Transcriptional regulator n=1 Tax=Cytobacillus oceanisediminis 2691 TaxID=1196031 RepID=A0A160MGX5_9BACI|nr:MULTISPECIES: GyrI-like domain-containing protein [Cytobacillus]EFV77920.1 transcription activator effector binding protein [Bacillus sp. 2_A_57_CT2]MCS0825567.1 GyrI-like domain-containing protein [Cytobacillus firmus]AND42606.1 transcriptional regulator [Cytobacillus oceanisediminis 2691]MCM3243771.1 GyrI-like domain-containing protein [Cytobacillus oceanisediminis]MCM3391857.1 GyrI-like domain-containing protein [Cytobacillus oceanisediminis]